mgnify:FL=1
MSIFDGLNMIGGLCLFLFGMNLMGQALEKRAGGKMRTLLGKMTGRKMIGFLTGLGITAVIQSSSATTVMVVGFVNSGLLTLRQAINVIMGANVGTTVTAWLLSLGGISSGALWVKLLKPSSFTPMLALIGIVLYMFCKSSKKKDTGMILLGFATLMYGMETMTGAVSGLKDVPGFQKLFLTFTNPVLGVLAGAVLTAIIQSSSASVGILQALAVTGQVSYGAAIPIIMGQNIGTCVTALLSAIGTNKNARRAAIVHLMFNIIGTVVWLSAFSLVRLLFAPALLAQSATMFGIAIAHSVFNVLCTALLLPLSGMLEKLALWIVPETKKGEEQTTLLDERLLATPPLALERCHELVTRMAEDAGTALKASLDTVKKFDPQAAWRIREDENRTDQYEDAVSTYLIRLSAEPLNQADSEETTAMLKYIGDFERIADHAVDILKSAEEMRDKEISFSPEAAREMDVLMRAVEEILTLTFRAFHENDAQLASRVEPLEQVIDTLKEELRTRHILRMTKGECSAEAGFVWSDLLTSLERTADHCSNVAGCVMDIARHQLSLHDTLRREKNGDGDFDAQYDAYAAEFSL